MIRILQIVPNMQAGGIETWLMNQYRCLDRTKIQYDFLVHYEKPFFYDEEIERLGGRIYRCSMREDSNILKYWKFLVKFFKEHPEYKVVHGHMPSFSFIFMGAARYCGVPVRINHSHNSSHNKSLKGFVEGLLTRFVKINSTHLFACSNLAGQYMYGKSKYTVIHNAVDVEKFRFNKSVRQEVRMELGLEDKFIVGHIGRFNLQKNHTFLLEIFKSFSEKRKDAILLLIGTGELLESVLNKVKSLGIEDKVKYIGVRGDTDRLYQAMDVFALPSLFEGLPVVGVEAQASGVPFLMSDTITREVGLINVAQFIPIDKGVDPWVEALCSVDGSMDRSEAYLQVAAKGYDIHEETKKIVGIYTDLYNNAAGR